MNIIKLIINIIFEAFYYIFKYKKYEDCIISLIRVIGEYNIIFIKIFQWIWINNNKRDNQYITEKIENEIHSYTNNTPYTESDIDYKSILDIYFIAKKNGDNFELDNLSPINSGTISLVFKGKLNGKNIAIKILRKNIKDKLEKGMELLINLENIIYYIPFLNYYVSTKIFYNNKIHILNQINFINETENLVLFYKKFKNNKLIKIPFTYEKYSISNPNIILMEYIDGNYLYQIDRKDLDNYFYPFFKFIANSIFYKKIFHCDLHQGNVLFFKEINEDKITYKVGVIDFGMITKLNTNEIDFIYLWLNGIFNSKFKELVEYMKNSTNLKEIFDNYENIDTCMNTVLNLYENEELFFSIHKTEILIDNIYTFLSLLKQYNCKISNRYNFFILSLIPIFSIFIKLGPDIEKRDEVKDLLNKMNNSELLD